MTLVVVSESKVVVSESISHLVRENYATFTLWCRWMIRCGRRLCLASSLA